VHHKTREPGDRETSKVRRPKILWGDAPMGTLEGGKSSGREEYASRGDGETREGQDSFFLVRKGLHGGRSLVRGGESCQG